MYKWVGAEIDLPCRRIQHNVYSYSPFKEVDYNSHSSNVVYTQ